MLPVKILFARLSVVKTKTFSLYTKAECCNILVGYDYGDALFDPKVTHYPSQNRIL